MKISPHFKRSEFACSCGCGFDTVDSELLSILEDVRTHFMSPVTVTSGCRCENHNYLIGGSPKSQHLLGRAVDIKVKGKSPEQVYDYIDKIYSNKLGLGRYSSWVHVDTRTDGGVRWG